MQDAEKWLRKHPLWLATGVIVFILGLAEYGHSFREELAVVDALVVDGITPDWVHHTLVPKPWFSALLLVLVILLVVSVVLLIRKMTVSNQPKSQLEQEIAILKERYGVAKNTLRGMMEAASRVREQLFPSADRPVKNLKSVDSVYLIYKNFDVEVRHVYEVTASDRPLHFMELSDGVEDRDEGVEYLDDIQFKVKDGEGKTLAYLLSRNDPKHKSIIVYFLPQVAPGEASPRKVIVTYRWPGALKQLDTVGSEPYAWSLVSKEKIREAKFQFYFEPGSGSQIHCEKAGALDGQQTLIDTLKHAEKDWPGWEYKIQDAPSGTYRLTVSLKKA
jgi:hypothetical protein